LEKFTTWVGSSQLSDLSSQENQEFNADTSRLTSRDVAAGPRLPSSLPGHLGD